LNIVTLSELSDCNFSITVVNAYRQHWTPRNSFSCFGNPKHANLLLYLDRCRAEYTLADGRIVHAPPGSFVYTPKGSQYKVQILDLEDSTAGTVGINFFLTGEDGEPFILSETVEIFTHIGCKEQVDRLEQLSRSSVRNNVMMKADFYHILAALYSTHTPAVERKFAVIQKGILYMEQDPHQLLSIKEVAELCAVSEIYFRRLFTEYAGVSPVEYRMRAKIEKAKKHLRYDQMNTDELTALLGFTDSSYFCRQFKKRTGMTPSAYRMQYK